MALSLHTSPTETLKFRLKAISHGLVINYGQDNFTSAFAAELDVSLLFMQNQLYSVNIMY